MTIWWLIFILCFIAAGGIAFIWLAVKLNSSKGDKNRNASYIDAATHDVEHIFNEDFREELRNRGRLHFEKIIGDNAMFLQQDLRLTTSQVNEYMKSEITRTLKEEFAKYEQSIADAKQIATESLQKTTTTIEEEGRRLSEQVKKEAEEDKRLIIEHFQANMTDIVNHYVVAAVGKRIDLNDQLEYILSELETNKAAIIEDIRNGA